MVPKFNEIFCPETGLLHCTEYLEKNIDWLEAKLKPLSKGLPHTKLKYPFFQYTIIY